MKKAKIAALFLSAVVLLTGCSDDGRFTESYFFPIFDNYSEDEREGETELLGIDERPSSMINMTSQELVNSIRVGWNLGNTFDVCQTDRDGDGKLDEHAEDGAEVDETLWGNPDVTRELFKSLTDDGVNAVRIPVTWRDHIDEFGNIDASWLNRVQQVVDYAYNCGLYVIINVHHDGADDREYGAWLWEAAESYDYILSRYCRIWAQLSDRFKNYNERIIFESLNEVSFDDLSEDDSYALLNSINQRFVDLVRSSGGNNGERHLLIAGYRADIMKTCDERFVMPDDPAKRCILSVHYYTPWEFCTANLQNTWGSRSEEREMESLVTVLCENFTQKGVPVIIDEYGTVSTDEESLVYFCEKLVKTCHDLGIACLLWDNGSQVDRVSYEWRCPELIEALVRATGGEDYTPEKGLNLEEFETAQSAD